MFSANTSQVSDDKLFVEDVFSTYLYTGNGSTQTIINGIDLAGQGGMVWIKDRNNTGDPKNHYLYDTVRGTSVSLSSNTTSGNLSTSGIQLTSFNNNGFSLGSSSNVNQNTFAHVAWTFREAPKFFDVVTYTGNGTNTQVQSHSLGTTPGMIIVKQTSASGENWVVWHRSLATSNLLYLNTADAAFVDNGTRIKAADATTFTVGLNGSTGANGATYVAYLFAHDATSDGIIQCGSFTNDGSGNATVSLGWEPQWVLIKSTASTAYDNNWRLYDNMRGMPVADSGISTLTLYPNTSGAEVGTNIVYPTATGFRSLFENPGTTYIYIAIRRGPMRTPTSGTSVFGVNTATQAINSSTRPPAVSFITDMAMYRGRSGVLDWVEVDRLRGPNWLVTNSAGAEASGINAKFDTMTGWYPDVNPWEPSGSYLFYNFRRAPSFFDEVCYTGTGVVGRTVAHNLGVAPELMIVKYRNSSPYNWIVYSAPTGNGNHLLLNTTAAPTASNAWNYTTPTATTFALSGFTSVNFSGGNYVAYLFASCPGVSKVGSYTGNGSSQTINCGFAAGARFVMIKRTDSTGDWYVWDSARGIVAGNDPRLSLNTTAAEVTTDDSVDTDSSGFVVNQLSATNINVSSATYIYLAVA